MYGGSDVRVRGTARARSNILGRNRVIKTTQDVAPGATVVRPTCRCRCGVGVHARGVPRCRLTWLCSLRVVLGCAARAPGGPCSATPRTSEGDAGQSV